MKNIRELIFLVTVASMVTQILEGMEAQQAYERVEQTHQRINDQALSVCIGADGNLTVANDDGQRAAHDTGLSVVICKIDASRIPPVVNDLKQEEQEQSKPNCFSRCFKRFSDCFRRKTRDTKELSCGAKFTYNLCSFITRHPQLLHLPTFMIVVAPTALLSRLFFAKTEDILIPGMKAVFPALLAGITPLFCLRILSQQSEKGNMEHYKALLLLLGSEFIVETLIKLMIYDSGFISMGMMINAIVLCCVAYVGQYFEPSLIYLWWNIIRDPYRDIKAMMQRAISTIAARRNGL